MSAIYPLSVHRRIERQWADRTKSAQSRIVIAAEEKVQRALKGASLLKSVTTNATAELAATHSAFGPPS
jgi:hypothetical protein